MSDKPGRSEAQRLDARYPVDVEVHVVPDGGLSTLVEISRRGARLVGERVSSGVGTTLRLRVRVGLFTRLEVPARVVWASSHARGLLFQDLSAEAQGWLCRTLALARSRVPGASTASPVYGTLTSMGQ